MSNSLLSFLSKENINGVNQSSEGHGRQGLITPIVSSVVDNIGATKRIMGQLKLIEEEDVTIELEGKATIEVWRNHENVFDR